MIRQLSTAALTILAAAVLTGGGLDAAAASAGQGTSCSQNHQSPPPGVGKAKPPAKPGAAPGSKPGIAPNGPAASPSQTGSAEGGNSGGGTTADPASGNGAVPSSGYSVVISGGYDTDSRDHGRPVVLIAAALGVPTDVFREAFSGVTPAGPGTGGPTGEQAQSNKAALLKVLGPYGITNDRLDEVSNYYRYMGSQGEVWKRTPAVASATVVNGKITGVTITNPGAGYSSTPTITIKGPNGTIKATAKVVYTKDFKTNGSISAITIQS